MSSITLPKNINAAATVGILNTIRWIGVAAYGLMLLITGLFAIAQLFQGNTSEFFVGLLGCVVIVIAAAIFYAVVGWFADTLSLLKQIAVNTQQ